MRYFAYGSNLHRGDFRRFCRTQGFDAGAVRDPEPAFLPDHRAVFGLYSKGRGGGALDVRPSLGDAVPGALFTVDAPGWAALDAKEGVASGRYERVRAPVLVKGRVELAITYRVRPEVAEPFVAPHDHYAGLAREGLRELGLPTAQLDRAADDARYGFPGGVFVYGTLMRGEERHGALQPLVSAEDAIQDASVQGRLIHLGAWPGLITPDAPSRVHGEWVRMEASADGARRTLVELDLIEDFTGYEAPQEEYLRVLTQTRVHERDDARWAWTYEYVGPTERSRPIPSGRWRDAPRRVVV